MTVHLISEAPSHDTVQTLNQLLAQAKEGKLKGLSYVAHYERRKKTVGATGSASDDPISSVGGAQYLISKLIASAE